MAGEEQQQSEHCQHLGDTQGGVPGGIPPADGQSTEH